MVGMLLRTFVVKSNSNKIRIVKLNFHLERLALKKLPTPEIKMLFVSV